MNPTPFDPKLKQAMAEIEAVCKKYDIGGFSVLVSKTHSEFQFELEPSWSAAKFLDKENGVLAVKSTAAENGADLSRKRTELTAHLILQIQDLCALGFQHMEQVATALRSKLEIEHRPYYQPDRES